MAREVFRDHFAATSKMAYFGHSRAKTDVFGLAILALRFQWFQRNSVDFQNPLFTKSRRATQKHKTQDGRGPRNKLWSFFEDPDWELRVAISR